MDNDIISTSDSLLYVTSPDFAFSTTPPLPYNITFYDGKNEVGTLTWPDGVFHFEGNADESARVFFDAIQKWANAWVKG